ncbi:unnamed protein product [Albugo candida]|uniref:Uncharacterized protein n=1 Tax=Albugo candida TaxID=65357 RepID=A0A024GU96_9STRA|nr:unnamed protein product [Albugo candida]CCI50185.1 unnamed protein product [Albugo candida]|eukprot:CCI50171.1 unnamed protein product [Albugo candida]
MGFHCSKSLIQTKLIAPLLHLLQLKRFPSLRSQSETRFKKTITNTNTRAFQLHEGLVNKPQNVDVRMQTHFSVKDGDKCPLYSDNAILYGPFHRFFTTATSSLLPRLKAATLSDVLRLL